MHSSKGLLENGLLLFATVLGGLGCSGGVASSDAMDGLTRGADGGVPASEQALNRRPSALETLGAMPAFAGHLGEGHKLERVGDGYRLVVHRSADGHVGGWSPDRGSIQVTLPAKASAPVRLELPAQKDFWVEITAPTPNDVNGQAFDGAVVLHDVAVDTDVVHTALPGRAEEIRLLRSSRASATTRYVVRSGPGVGLVRARDGRFEILDHSGHVRIASAAVFAVDAKGTRRDATVEASAADTGWDLTTNVDVSGLAYPIVVDPAWTAAGNLKVGLGGHRGSLLKDGRVLIEGGGIYDSAGTLTEFPTKTAEIYDITLDSWSLAKSMNTPRANHTATVLLDGRVLVAAGGDANAYPNLPLDSEVYDPASDTWTSTGKMYYGFRLNDPAALLHDGRVLIIGGWEGGLTDTVEAYNPSANSWAPVASLPAGRLDAAAVTLLSGEVLVFGGAGPLATALKYDPTQDKWSTAGSMVDARTFGPSGQSGYLLLPSGKVFVAGGDIDYSANTLATAEIYDPATDKWTSVKPMSFARGYGSLRTALLPNGEILATGGFTPGYGWQLSGEVYDPIADKWGTTDSMLHLHQNGAMVTLADGRILNSGGTSDSVYSEVFYLHPNGDACVSANDCLNGHCVDGYCCDSACSTQCEACNRVGKEGICGPRSGKPTGGRAACTGAGTTCGGSCDGISTTCVYAPATVDCRVASCTSGLQTLAAKCDGAGTCPLSTSSCGQYLCVGATCGASCTSDSNCSTTGYCDSVTGCTLKKQVGQRCGGTNECELGNCVDGYCCDGACTGQCEACNLGGKLGICSPSTGVPHGSRTPCVTNVALCAGTCDGTVTTACTYPSGTQCRSASCTGGVATLAGSCDGAGACPLATKACAPGACQGAVCGTTCTQDSGCDGTAYCAGTVCTTKKAAGQACSGANECKSGNCVNGVCCDKACGGQCEACDLTGYVGTCLPVPPADGTPHGTRAKCTTDATACGGKCDGIVTATCSYPGVNTNCRAGSCASDIATLPTQCNGSGLCPASTVQPCAPYQCNAAGTACDGCSTTKPCASGYYCSGGVCNQNKGNATACGADTECTSGFCVDGVCCDAACGGQCEACDVTNKVGTCSPVPSGNAPHSASGTSRPTCGGDAICGGTCNGVSRTACGYTPSTTQCRPSTCLDGTTAIASANCDGVGSCPPQQTVDCAPDVCTGSQCTGCTLDADCASGNHCVAGKCLPFTAKGGTCSQASDCATGLSCVDAVCCDSACSGQCQACDVPNSKGTCTTVSSGPPHGGRSACAGTGTCGATCDGTSATACAYPGASVVCALGSCASGTETTAAYCDGQGACGTQTSARCGAYGCGATACKTMCSSATDCAQGNSCVGSQCVSGAGGGAGADAGTGAAAGRQGTGGAGAVNGGGPGGAGGRGVDAGGVGVTEPSVKDNGGCGCRMAGAPEGGWGASAMSLLAAAGALLRRRRGLPRNAA